MKKVKQRTHFSTGILSLSMAFFAIFLLSACTMETSYEEIETGDFTMRVPDAWVAEKGGEGENVSMRIYLNSGKRISENMMIFTEIFDVDKESQIDLEEFIASNIKKAQAFLGYKEISIKERSIGSEGISSKIHVFQAKGSLDSPLLEFVQTFSAKGKKSFLLQCTLVPGSDSRSDCEKAMASFSPR